MAQRALAAFSWFAILSKYEATHKRYRHNGRFGRYRADTGAYAMAAKHDVRDADANRTPVLHIPVHFGSAHVWVRRFLGRPVLAASQNSARAI